MVLHTACSLHPSVRKSTLEESHRYWSHYGCVSLVRIRLPTLWGSLSCRDGKKMSKSLKNYPDPTLVIDKYGADATRFLFYFINKK